MADGRLSSTARRSTVTASAIQTRFPVRRARSMSALPRLVSVMLTRVREAWPTASRRVSTAASMRSSSPVSRARIHWT